MSFSSTRWTSVIEGKIKAYEETDIWEMASALDFIIFDILKT
jgi:hypothetical protein